MAKSFLVVVVVLHLLRQTSCLSKRSKVALFMFGDSFFDVGNNNYINTSTLDQANFWPYGETYFNNPTGRFSDGRLVPDFIAEYAKLPLLPPFLQPGSHNSYYYGANFASAGAGALVQTFQGSVINMETQLKYLKKVRSWLKNKLGSWESQKMLSNAVYFFSIGSNDYLSLFVTNSTLQLSSPQYVQMVVGNLTSIVKEIYKGGGRKFGFLNLGELGCLPGLRILNPSNKNGCLERASNLAKLHNSELYNALLIMEKELKGFKYSLYDFNSSLGARMNHPSRYGLKEGKIACCGTGRFRGILSCGGKRPVKQYELCKNPSVHVFWDSYHLTQTVYQQLAAEMWHAPSNLKSLF